MPAMANLLNGQLPDFLDDKTPQVGDLGSVLGNSALIISRAIEWGGVILGFEQANKYTLMNQDGTIVGYLAEESNSIGNAVARNVLRGRRNFSATGM